jgi:hypothetical protein
MNIDDENYHPDQREWRRREEDNREEEEEDDDNEKGERHHRRHDYHEKGDGLHVRVCPCLAYKSVMSENDSRDLKCSSSCCCLDRDDCHGKLKAAAATTKEKNEKESPVT